MEREQLMIGALLVKSGAITAEQLREGLNLQMRREGKICQILMSLGYLTETQLLECLGNQNGFTKLSVEPYVISPALMAFVPSEFAVAHEVMPLDRVQERLTLALGGPYDTRTPEVLERQTGLSVRSVLCARRAVRAAISQYYDLDEQTVLELLGTPASTVRIAIPDSASDTRAWGGAAETLVGPEAVRLRNALDIISTLDAFPLLPETHLQLLERMDDPEADLDQMVPIIEHDPTLSANILKLANSAAYGTHGGLDDIRRAVIFLGMRQLRSTVLACAVLHRLSVKAECDLTGAFHEAYQLGLLTKIVCDTARYGDRDAAFTAGLLANLGRIALRIYSPEYVALIDRVHTATSRESTETPGVQRTHTRLRAEEAVMGVSGSELGYHLAARWGLPASLTDTIRFHDRLDRVKTPPPLAVAVALAEYCLARDEETGTFGDPAGDAELAWLLMALDRPAAVLRDIEDEYRGGVEALGAVGVGR